jgi:hypothetical protein
MSSLAGVTRWFLPQPSTATHGGAGPVGCNSTIGGLAPSSDNHWICAKEGWRPMFPSAPSREISEGYGSGSQQQPRMPPPPEAQLTRFIII